MADRLVRHGAAVYGMDHVGHGKSEGDRALIEDFEDVVTDVHAVEERARRDHPGVPLVVIGHSMGGMIAARYAQLHGIGLAALVLSGPVIGEWEVVSTLLALDEVPGIPLDPAMLSRDPSVGATAAADPLVWHGPFKRPTLDAFAVALTTLAEGGTFGAVGCTAKTTSSCPAGAGSTPCGGPTCPSGSTRAAGTRCLTRPTRTRSWTTSHRSSTAP
ncbi:alpha/beta fold hydrolase [Nonomuraea dietziae]|uniref:alpha/beta fold hydrolase n=1 Tax=Nonomuraea dietziae TaxID=65515 RepID=UPI0033F6D39D